MDYFERLEKETYELYEIANAARAKGLDVETKTEIPLAKDLAERVEGLVGPVGVAARIKELETDLSREEVAFTIAAEIASEEIEETGEKAAVKRESLADQGLRTALAILTEGVVAAPLEGIAAVKIKKNSDGGKYLAVYFAGPIRSAGGTAAALAVLLGDKIREATGLDIYKPTEAEIERYVEEVELYESEVTNLQYSPKPEEVRHAAKNIPVEVTGEQTDKVEVSHRDLERVETNNIRGGALLAMIEGVVQKAKKVSKYTKILKLDKWEFLSEFTKENKPKEEPKDGEEKKEIIKEEPKYIQDIIGGRPVLGYPGEKGGFRLRYGRSRNTGLAAMGVSPITMELVEFLAVGTQLKIEKPGKGNCVVPVDSIEGPIVKLKNGDVVKVKSIKEAKSIRKYVTEILFLGDMLVAFGEFLRNNQNLLPSAWCSEWWAETILNSPTYLEELKSSIDNNISNNISDSNNKDDKTNTGQMTFGKSSVISNYNNNTDSNTTNNTTNNTDSNTTNITNNNTTNSTNNITNNNTDSNSINISINKDYNKIDINNTELDLNNIENSYLSAKDSFELSKKYGVPLNPEYTYCYNDISVDDLQALIKWINKYTNDYKEGDKLTLDLSYEKRILEVIGVPHIVKDGKIIIDVEDSYAIVNTLKKPIAIELLDGNVSPVDAINTITDVKIMDKAPVYIGSRVGRPEKSKERLMKPAPHVLFPIGNYGGSRRLVAEAAKKGSISVEFSRRQCTNCQISSFQSLCPNCGSKTEVGKPGKKKINLSGLLRKASENVGVRRVDEIKAVIGMISESKLPEPLEKGILRAKNEVFTFKDATIRHDSTDLPLTHFTPKEVGVTLEQLEYLGYDHDAYGKPITEDTQIIELKVQDVIISKNCGEYLVKVASFIDDLLDKFYEMDRFYNVEIKEDLIGHLIAGLAPHTSAGVLGRVVGFTNALACYAHPYFHSAKRRNCDSDEDSVMLLLDALINFSKSYLPSTRGGSMDAPLVLSSRIDPEEIDDESHNIDVMDKFSLEFFNITEKEVKPTEAVNLIDNVSKHLGTPKQYEDLMFSHNTSNIHAGPNICLYKTLPSMKEKVGSQIALAEIIRAVDQRGVVEGVLSSHFLPDIMGNARAFSKQKVRCTKCNSKYRRMPLTGKCKCGENLILSVSKGSVQKYLEISKELVQKYPISHYLVQRLEIQEFGINSLFESDKSKQSSLDVFM
ncbi:DNA polymerase II large subunit [Methanobrevibacter filiformis]|uniref:DNA polymerase II large subunit n=1 Tax=Methanobrevibacter filiformis TaxID=55758 RepID=A0A165Z6R0_9EURY|nr:DNA polymerase II large subunit [Methanobrevibacter filiformis]KZX10316.1 DNA polymerase II large subunit [Methanobrevibacter filiformis]